MKLHHPVDGITKRDLVSILIIGGDAFWLIHDILANGLEWQYIVIATIFLIGIMLILSMGYDYYIHENTYYHPKTHRTARTHSDRYRDYDAKANKATFDTKQYQEFED